METKTQIVTHLVAAFLTSPERMQDIRWSYDNNSQTKPDYVLAVDYANIIADEILDKTTAEIVFDNN